MTTFVRMIAISMAAVLLAGCQSSPFSGWGFAKKSQTRTAARAAPKIIGAQLIEEGRALLHEGRISAAVATFRLARLDASTAAEAENGLGVSYAKLGRFDLADGYFRAAVARDPKDMRFTANLLRLQHHVMLARKSALPAERIGAEPEPRTQDMARADRLHRISDGIVRIATREELGERPQMAIAYLDKHSAAPIAESKLKPEGDAAVVGAASNPLVRKEKLVVISR